MTRVSRAGRCARTAAGFLALLATVPGAAGAADSLTPSLAGPAGAQGVALLKLLAALGVVLLAFWVCARLLARFGRGRTSGSAGLDILGSVSLGQRERLVVVQAGSTRLVVGVTAHAITPVHVLEVGEDATEVDTSLADAPSRARHAPTRGTSLQGLPSGADFAARLRSALGRPVE